MKGGVALAQRKNPTASQKSVEDVKVIYEAAPKQRANFKKGEDALKKLVDLSKGTVVQSVSTINRETLRSYFTNVASNTERFRAAARYLYYRSNVFYRIVSWYSGMFALECRRVTPQYSFTKANNANKAKKSLNDTFDKLDNYDFKHTLQIALINCFVEDVFYGIRYTDDNSTVIIPIPQEYCIIDGVYQTGDFSFAVDCKRLYRQKRWQYIIDNIGEPLSSMLKEQERTNEKYVHATDEYAVCLKFDMKDPSIIIPPLARIMLMLSALEDNIDIQAVADQLSIFKLVYLPLDTINSAKDSDEFQVSPDLAVEYFNKILNDALPKYVSGGVIPGKELKTIDFAQNAEDDVNRVQTATDNILSTAGGGAILNSRFINNNLALKIWLQEETNFAINTLLPQIEGLTNRLLTYDVSNPAHVEYFKVSPYTQEDKAKELLEACQYGYPDRLAYNTLLGISERETMASMWMEFDLLGLQDKMIYPLASSYTQSSDGEVGRPETPDEELTDSGQRTRDR